MHRTDYDFDVISGPSTQALAPQAVLPSATPPRLSSAAPVPVRPTKETADAGEKG